MPIRRAISGIYAWVSSLAPAPVALQDTLTVSETALGLGVVLLLVGFGWKFWVWFMRHGADQHNRDGWVRGFETAERLVSVMARWAIIAGVASLAVALAAAVVDAATGA